MSVFLAFFLDANESCHILMRESRLSRGRVVLSR